MIEKCVKKACNKADEASSSAAVATEAKDSLLDLKSDVTALKNETVAAADRAGNIVIPAGPSYTPDHIDSLVDGNIDKFNQTLYVDSTNGHDTNIGSVSSPLKTLYAACVSIPVGGKGIIYLKDGEYIIDRNIILDSKNILIKGNNGAENVLVTQATYMHSTVSQLITYGIHLRNSNIKIFNCTLRTPNLIPDVDSFYFQSGFFKREDFLGNSSVEIIYCDLKIGDSSFIKNASGALAMDFHIYSGSIDLVGENSDSFLYILSQNCAKISIHGTALGTKRDNVTPLLLSDLIAGVIYDAAGHPRNLLSNKIF